MSPRDIPAPTDDGSTNADASNLSTSDRPDDLETWPLDRLEHELVVCAVAETQHLGRVMQVMGTWLDRDGPTAAGYASAESWCGHWLGLSPGTARERVRIARALRFLPLTMGALSSGTLSWSKVRAVTRVASPESESVWLELARTVTAAQLERAVAGFKHHRAEEEGQLRCAHRSVSHRSYGDGTVEIRVRLLPDEAEPLLDALREATTEVCRDQPGRTWSEASADAFIGLFWSDAPPVAEVYIHTDVEVLQHPDTAEGRCHTQDGAPVSAAAARRIACDCTSVAVIRDTDNELRLGTTRRTPSRRQRRALRVRDRCCRFPGCRRTTGLHAHHIVHWIDHGPTVLSNLVLICEHHHRAVHEHGFVMTGTATDLHVLHPNGWEVTNDDPWPGIAEWLFADLAMSSKVTRAADTLDDALKSVDGFHYRSDNVLDMLLATVPPAVDDVPAETTGALSG
jgi:hypothetical protein